MHACMHTYIHTYINIHAHIHTHTRAVSKFRGLVAVRRCYAEGSGDCYANS
jgi:hypothetical protein